MSATFPKPSKQLIVIILLTVFLTVLSAKFYTTRSIILSFDVISDEDLAYRLYYKKKSAHHFTEQNSVKKLVSKGKSNVIITIPSSRLAGFQLFVENTPKDLTIYNLSLKGLKKVEFNDFNKFQYTNIKNKKISLNTLTITSNHNFPSITYDEKLLMRGGIIIDWYVFIILITFYFFTSWKLVKYLAKFKIEKNHSRIDIVFLCLFFALLFIPMSYISDAEKSEQENRMLATKPSLRNLYKQGYNYGAKFEQWFNDRFLGRDDLVLLNSNIQNKLTTRGNENVLIGKDGWLFYKGDNSLRNYQNLDLFTEKELQNVAKYLSDINNWAIANNKDFYYMICPDKNKIYGENILYLSQVNPVEKSRANQLIKYLEANTNIKVIYPYDAIHKAKKEGLLYWKNDTHWNMHGAYVGYLELMTKMLKHHNLPIVKNNGYKTSQHLKGDLTHMMKGLKDDKTTYLDPIIKDTSKCSKNTNIENNIVCTNKNNKKVVYVYRDSFADSLFPFLNNTFGKVNYFGRPNLIKNDLSDLKETDIIILEQVERSVHRLSNLSFPKD